MSTRSLVVLIAVVLGGVGVQPAMAAKGKPKLVTPRCAITSITAVAATGKVAATGACKVRGKYPFYRVPITWRYTYTADDGQYVCGSPRSGKAKAFKVRPPGAYKVAVRFTLSAKPRKGLRRVKPFVRIKVLVLGGQSAMCGRLGEVPLPPPGDLCKWQEPVYGKYCGSPQPGSECAWTHTASLVDGLFSGSRLACKSGNCWIEPVRTEPSFEWLGSTVTTSALRCGEGEGTLYLVQTWMVSMTNPQGVSCGPIRPKVVDFLSFRVPLNWGGTLFVMQRFQGSGGQEVVTYKLDLPGKEDGCPILLASGRPFGS